MFTKEKEAAHRQLTSFDTKHPLNFIEYVSLVWIPSTVLEGPFPTLSR